jgi:tetratricopeptide (TPR) repeat protein
MGNNYLCIEARSAVGPSTQLVQHFLKLERAASLPTQPWAAAFAEGLHLKAIELLDQVLATEPENTLARLVWIRSHLAAGQLPTTALCSPLEDVAKKLPTDRSTQGLAQAVFGTAAIALEQREQTRLAWSMIDKAVSISADDPSNSSTCLLDYALQLLELEIDRADKKRESPLYKDSLAQAKIRLNAARAKSPQTAPEQEPARPEKAARVLSAKQLAESAVLDESSDIAIVPEKAQTSTRSKFYMVALGLLIAGFGAWQYFSQLATPVAVAEAPIQLAMDRTSSLVPPRLEVSANRPLNKKLESVGERLENLRNDPTEQGQSSDPNEVDPDKLKPEHASGLKVPISAENDEIEAIEGPDPIEEKVPAFDTAKIPATITQSVEQVGSTKNKMPIPPAALGNALSVDNQGRVFGPASNQDPAQRANTPTALDGSQLKSYEVEQFNPPILFHTITATRVVSAPSILSSTLAELPENTPVHVSARMGRWLELRSTGGKVGYIFAQDAVQTRQ